MDTVLNLNCDLSSMYTYNSAQKSKLTLSHQPLRKSRHETHEISGLEHFH